MSFFAFPNLKLVAVTNNTGADQSISFQESFESDESWPGTYLHPQFGAATIQIEDSFETGDGW